MVIPARTSPGGHMTRSPSKRPGDRQGRQLLSRSQLAIEFRHVISLAAYDRC
ncbi:MAG: hypothetical protein ACREN8_09925 [Candidatus Dormibacteraceae bacterium]